MRFLFRSLAAAAACLHLVAAAPQTQPSDISLRSRADTGGVHSLEKRRSWAKGISKKLTHIVDQAEKAGKDVVGAVSDALKDIDEELRPTAEDIGEAFSDVVSEIAKLFQPAVCAVVAKTLVPFYDTSADMFAALNPGPPAATNADQNFFLYPFVGDLVLDGIRIHYRANFAPGFSAHGVTMGRDVYVDSYAASAAPTSADFFSTVSLLLHELAHCRQYRDRGWRLHEFGERYLYGWCAAGFKYAGNDMEREADAVENRLDGLLTPQGIRYYQLWRSQPAVAALGYPSNGAPVPVVGGGPAGMLELQFERGVVLLNAASCFRVLTADESKARSLARCTIRPCVNSGVEMRRAESGPAVCTEAIREDNFKCRLAHTTWAKALKDGFTC
ncbi:hypothetical protein B0T26DRAFT_517447 [Lasiosphaeria miniovina]|uniref:Uncharacterized protein n=1 Tax=Lasiosphaeria miniovina TaxID=1954250 RepID=A0AA40DK90_9PEZI|nr:uncharacterized protein B0T26DRAFT_517447 [Lasiosphaeria miniovina]KAK0703897.1 hypothetical protein B0T26DRAFT_517447 [Lasiosphaeria miniovina]